MYEEQQSPSGSSSDIGSDKGGGEEVTCVWKVVEIAREKILKTSNNDLVEEHLKIWHKK